MIKIVQLNFIKEHISITIINGCQRDCKTRVKKNTLYREFIKHRTKELEDKYKKYKNKIIS